MYRVICFLSVIILVNCHGKHPKGHGKHPKVESSHCLSDQVAQLKSYVNELAEDTVSESNDLVMADLKALYDDLKENKVTVDDPGKAEVTSEEEKVEMKMLEIETRDNSVSTKNQLIEAVLKAALHCRGEDDVTLGKVLDLKSNKREVGDCVLDSAHKEQIKDILIGFEQHISYRFSAVFGKLLDDLENLLKSDFDRESLVEMEDIKKAATLRVASTMERIESTLQSIVGDAKYFDEHNKHQDKEVDRVQQVWTDNDAQGYAMIKKALIATEVSGKKQFMAIRKLVVTK